MKKSLSLGLAITSVLMISGSALALDVAEDGNLTLIDEEPAATMDVLTRNIWNPDYCGYRLRFIDLYQPNQAVFCDAVEALPVDVASCSDAYRFDFETHLLAGNWFGTKCRIIDSIGDKLEVDLAVLSETDYASDRLFGNVMTCDGELHEIDVLH
jgi:hypothetical protein